MTDLRKLFARLPGLLLLSSNGVFVGMGYVSDAITTLRHQSLFILGMEGFTTDGYTVTPLMECIADFSSIQGDWAAKVEQSASAAELIVGMWQHGPMFVVFGAVDQAEDAALEAAADRGSH